MPLSSIQIPGSEGRTQRTDWTLFRLRHHIISVCACVCVCAGKRGIHRDIASREARGGVGRFESGKEKMKNKKNNKHKKKKKKKTQGRRRDGRSQPFNVSVTCTIPQTARVCMPV